MASTLGNLAPIIQTQFALQANVNLESATAIAFAKSDDVKVKQSGDINAGGDGIKATSSA
jgi:hypothetical protein